MRQAIVWIISLIIFLGGSLIAENGDSMKIPESKYYFVELLGTREGWPEIMTEKEQQVMAEHFEYLKSLTAQSKVLMAGPVFGKFGLIILKVYSEDEARQIMADEPSVKQGVHKYTMTPMIASLMAQYTPPDRYVQGVAGRVLHKETVVDASLEEVWHKWTTSEGASSIFGTEAIVELRTGGPYEILFFDEAPYGSKGSEDCKLLSYIPHRMLSFEWNAPPDFGELRFIKTQIVMFFEQIEPGKVKIDFNQFGWGIGEKWDKLFTYFDNAWGYVLENCSNSFEE